MPIWRLDPIDTTSAHWDASAYRSRVIARAADENRARTLAKLAFGIAVTRHHPGQDTIYPPWGQEELVACVRVDDSKYPDDGPEGILEPEHVDHGLGVD